MPNGASATKAGALFSNYCPSNCLTCSAIALFSLVYPASYLVSLHIGQNMSQLVGIKRTSGEVYTSGEVHSTIYTSLVYYL